MIRAAYERMLAEYGPQGWWPADEPFEIMVGALLVQQTTWAAAAMAVAALKDQGLLRCEALAAAPLEVLQRSIRPAGFFRVKSRRLNMLAQFVAAAGGVRALRERSTPRLRSELLALEGIGEETADAILLYAFERAVVVVDAYSQRWYARMRGTAAASVLELRTRVAGELAGVEELNEWHALVVEHSKRACRKTPLCARCCLNSDCQRGRNAPAP